MSISSNINFFTTILTSACVCFAASNFGIKLGRLTSFQNTSGYEYISSSDKKDLFYDDVVKVSEKDLSAPDWAKNKDKLKKHCEKYEKSARYWKETSKYCLIKNNVRHQLIKSGLKLKKFGEGECTDEILNLYSDDSQNSLNYLYGRKKCIDETQQNIASNTSLNVT